MLTDFHTFASCAVSLGLETSNCLEKTFPSELCLSFSWAWLWICGNYSEKNWARLRVLEFYMSSTLLLRRKFKLGYKTWSSYVWNKAGVAMYFHFPPKYQENLSWNSSTCCGNSDSMRNQLWSSAVSGWGFSDLGDWKLPAVTETGAGWSCFSQSRAGHLDIFLLGKEMSLPPPEYLDNTEILTPPWLENLPECWCFSSKLRTLSVSVKRRIKCLPQYPREINIHKLSAMFLDAWPAGKAGTGDRKSVV